MFRVTRLSVCGLVSAVFLAGLMVSAGAQEKKGPSPDDQYVPGPDSKEQPGVPKGEVTKYSWNESKIYPGTVRDYWVYVPKQYNAAKPACVYVNQDSIQYEAPKVFDNLIHKKEMPVTIGIFIQPGDIPLKEGETRQKRADGRAAPRKRRPPPSSPRRPLHRPAVAARPRSCGRARRAGPHACLRASAPSSTSFARSRYACAAGPVGS